MKEEAEYWKIDVKCPICEKTGLISIPSYLLEKKRHMIKIDVQNGICCEHNFLIYLNDKLKVIGSEGVDFTLQKSVVDSKSKQLTINDMVNIFNINSAAHILHALLFNFPINLLYNEKADLETYTHLLNLFKQFINQEFVGKIKLELIDHEQIKKADSKNALILSSKYGIIFNTPWEPISLKNETNILKKALDIMDSDQQYVIIKSEFQLFFDIAKFLGNLLQKGPQIYEEDIRNELSKKYNFDFISDYDLEFYKNIITTYQLGDVKRIKKMKKVSQFFENF